MDIILIGGLWLDAAVWDETAAALEHLGHRPVVPALPGVADRSATATLDDQVSAVVAAVDAVAAGVAVVGHSAACTLAWIAADRRPDAVSRVLLVGGFPAADGETYADFFATTDGVMPFPGWGPFEGADSADLDEQARERVAQAAVPVAEGVSKGVVRLGDPRRYDIPVVMVCPEYSAEQAKAWVADGQLPEITAARDVSYLDIDSGHWPMVSQPVEFAQAIHGAVGGA